MLFEHYRVLKIHDRQLINKCFHCVIILSVRTAHFGLAMSMYDVLAMTSSKNTCRYLINVRLLFWSNDTPLNERVVGVSMTLQYISQTRWIYVKHSFLTTQKKIYML